MLAITSAVIKICRDQANETEVGHNYALYNGNNIHIGVRF